MLSKKEHALKMEQIKEFKLSVKYAKLQVCDYWTIQQASLYLGYSIEWIRQRLVPNMNVYQYSKKRNNGKQFFSKKDIIQIKIDLEDLGELQL